MNKVAYEDDEIWNVNGGTDYWERFTLTGRIADYLSYTACTGEMYHDGDDNCFGNSTEFHDDRRV